MAFDRRLTIGMTLNNENAEIIAREGKRYMCTPENSIQHPVVTFAPHDIVGARARVIPFLGQLRPTPSRAFPVSHNAGEFGVVLVDAPQHYRLPIEQLEER